LYSEEPQPVDKHGNYDVKEEHIGSSKKVFGQAASHSGGSNSNNSSGQAAQLYDSTFGHSMPEEKLKLKNDINDDDRDLGFVESLGYDPDSDVCNFEESASHSIDGDRNTDGSMSQQYLRGAKAVHPPQSLTPPRVLTHEEILVNLQNVCCDESYSEKSNVQCDDHEIDLQERVVWNNSPEVAGADCDSLTGGSDGRISSINEDPSKN